MKDKQKELKRLILKYWTAGMNNAYWCHISSKVDKDIEIFLKKKVK